MSLLLDALKKSGQAQKNGARGEASSLDKIDPMRAAGESLFAAKTAPPTSRMRLSIILFIIGGSLLAAGGGYYIWKEISSSAPPARTSVAETESRPPSAQGMPEPTNTPPKKANPVPAGAVAAANNTSFAPPSPRRSTANAGSAIHIDRNQTDEGVDTTLLAAYEAYRSGDFASAWQRYRTVLQQDARNRDALLGMAAIAQQQGQDAVAAQYYEHVLALDPRDPAAHAGMAAIASGDAANTESRLKLALSHRPDAAPLYFALGNLYAGQSRWGEAQQAYFNAYNRQPAEAQYALNLAVSLDHLGKGTLAATYYQRALQLDQSSTSGFNRAPGFNHDQVQQRANELTAR